MTCGRVPGLRLLTDETDRESYRRDETAHFEPGLPPAVALEEQVGTDAVEVMRAVKRALDPAGILNLGRVL